MGGVDGWGGLGDVDGARRGKGEGEGLTPL